MTFVSNRTRLGRYVYAIGGNPEAAVLAGVDNRKITIAAFAIIGPLAAICAVIATARLNAAAAFGGASLAGGTGTIFGAFFGALIIQSIQTGMVLLGFDTPVLQRTLGVALCFAVWLDFIYRTKMK